MKPRLQTATLTVEDIMIWHLVCARWTTRLPKFAQPWLYSEGSDRRDADLMLSLRQAREQLREYGYYHGLLASNTVIREIADLSSPDPSNWYHGGVPLPRLSQ